MSFKNSTYAPLIPKAGCHITEVCSYGRIRRATSSTLLPGPLVVNRGKSASLLQISGGQSDDPPDDGGNPEGCFRCHPSVYGLLHFCDLESQE